MRIISGTHKGRRLIMPDDRQTRPTTDRVKEALFNLLVHSLGVTFEGMKVLDIYAGSGALGVEALSRGAAHATFIEHQKSALQAIRHNTKPFSNKWVLNDDATSFVLATPQQYDLIFLDPPYGQDLLIPTLTHIVAKEYVAKDALLILEMGHKETFDVPSFLHIQKEKTYRHTKLVFCRFSKP